MIIHTSADEQVIRHAAATARVQFDRFVERGSRTHTRAFNVTLTGESARLPHGGRSHTYDPYGDNVHAATWDQWGVFLAAIFAADPDAKMTYYTDADDFHWQTDGRFEKGWPEDAHGDHKWEVGVPFVQTCKRCSAVKRWSIR